MNKKEKMMHHYSSHADCVLLQLFPHESKKSIYFVYINISTANTHKKKTKKHCDSRNIPVDGIELKSCLLSLLKFFSMDLQFWSSFPSFAIKLATINIEQKKFFRVSTTRFS